MYLKVNSLKKWFSIEIIFLILLKLVLDLSYHIFVYPLFSYSGIFSYDFQIVKYLESFFLLFLVIAFTDFKENRISNIFMNIQLVVMITPMLSIYGFANSSRVFMYLICFCYCIQSLIMKPKEKPNKIRITESKMIVNGFIALIFVVTIAFVFYKYGLPDFRALNIYNVYEVRADNILSFPLNYFLTWLAEIILPLILIFGIHKKKYSFVFISIAIEGYIYLTFAKKTYIFILFIVFATYYLVKKKCLLKCMYVGMPVFTFLTMISYYVNSNFLILPSLFIRRLLFVPASLKFIYYDFFVNNEKVFFADGLIGKLFQIDSPYQDNVAKLIAKYVGNPESSCNTGYMADAYANLGIVGVVIISILLALFIRIIEKNTDKIELSIVASAFVFPFYSLNDSAFLTRLLTGGGILLVFLLMFLNMKKSYRNNTKERYLVNLNSHL